jgi:hypothetical protein
VRPMETFVVRAWRPAADESLPSDADALRGVVEHVGSGTTMPFRDVDQLVAFMLGGGADDMPVEAEGRAPD